MNSRSIYVLICIGMLITTFTYLSSCQSKYSIQTAQYAVNGQKIYNTHCQNCHGADGSGLGKLYPPLTDQNFLKQNRPQLSCIVRYGMKDTITIHGQSFSGEMPANPQLTDLDIAYVLTYITTRFGATDSIYSHEEVTRALKNCN